MLTRESRWNDPHWLNRQWMKGKLVYLIAVSILVGALGFISNAAAQQYGGTLVLGMIADIQRSDPHRQTGNPSNQVLSLITESLVELDEQGRVSPGLAESWKVSDDATQHTFFLRKGVLFHNNRELVANDVKKSYQHMRDPKTGSPKRADFEMIERIEVIDKYTVKFYLKEPNAGFGATYFGANAPIIPPETFDTNRPVGTGPFQFVEWKPRQHLKVKRFDKYWREGLPYVDEIIFKPVVDDTVRYTGLLAGDLDFVFSLPFAQLPVLSKRPPAKIVPSIKGGSRWFFLNLHTQRGPLKDVRVRRAIAYALDKKTIMDGLSWGFAHPEAQPYPPGSQWYFSDVQDPYQQANLIEARRLLQQAGHSGGFRLVAIVRNETLIRDLAVLVQAQLRKIGIDVKLEVMDRASHLARQNKHDFDLNPGHMGFFPDPGEIFYRLNHSGVPDNWGLYSNPEFDELVEQGRRTMDVSKRR
ncbi:ABC transporter substrate-binding protein, partial [Acidobacteria bacterium AH-259-D05]|nr:ABC transporter substrate-binding protein [Acidobacteria bacterium AH-259-D05]